MTTTDTAPAAAPSPSGPPERATRLPFFAGLRIVIGLELRQRVRGVSSFVLLGLFFVLVGLVTTLVVLATGVLSGSGAEPGGWLYSIVVYFVLLLGLLVTPALSGAAINGDRDAGTLATTQVTLLSTPQLVLGKFVASWITALAFLVSATPFLLVAILLGGLSAGAAVASLLVLALELGVVAAIGVGLSAVIGKPLMSVVTSYLVIAALAIGSLIAFGLLTMVTTSTVRTTVIESSDPTSEVAEYCAEVYYPDYSIPRQDLYWGLLAANPFVVLADAVPPSFGEYDSPDDAFTGVAWLVRSAQVAPDLEPVIDCDEIDQNWYGPNGQPKTGEELFASTVPSWFVGLALHLLLAAGALAWGIARTRTPAGRLPRGNRVA